MVGDINKFAEKDKQLVVVIIDIVTTIKRKNYIINTVRNKRAKQQPVIAMYSLVVSVSAMLVSMRQKKYRSSFYS